MKTKLLVLVFLAALLTSCAIQDSQPATIPSAERGWNISVFHDGEREVTCWLYNARGISCIPDYMLYGADNLMKWREIEP